MKINKYFYVAIIISSVNLKAQECPIPPTAIDFKIDSSYRFDKKTQDYIYTYRVSNGRIAKTGVYMFKIESDQEMTPVQLPNKWSSRFQSVSQGFNPSVTSVMSGFDELKAGSNPIEFKFKSKQGPGITKYYAEGATSKQLQATTVNGDNEVPPTCPGYFQEEESTLKQMVTGTTIGPVQANQIEATIKLKILKDKPVKGCDDEKPVQELSPLDEGTIEVIIDKAEGVDLSKIDLNSIAFGPYQTQPFYSEILQNKSKINHWRKKFGRTNKILYMKFKLSEIKVRCDLDKELVLSANAGEKRIIGSVTIKPVMCTDKLMKSHRNKFNHFLKKGHSKINHTKLRH